MVSRESLRQGESSDMMSKDLDVEEMKGRGSGRQQREDKPSPSGRRASTLMKVEARSFQDALVEKGGAEKANATEATPL